MKKKREKEPEFYTSALNNQLRNYNVYYMKPIEKMLYVAIAFLLGGIVGLVFYANLFMVDGEATFATHVSNLVVFCGIGLVAVKLFIPMREETLKKKRQEELRMQFREMLSSLSASFMSGANIVTAFENAKEDMMSQYGGKAMIVCETLEMTNGMKNNLAIAEILNDFGRRSGIDDIRDFATVFSVCYEKGGDMKGVVRNTYDLIGEKMAINEEIQTKLTSNKMQQNIMSFVPIVMIAFLRLSSSSFASSFATLKGVVVMTVAIGIFIASYVYGRKIVDIKG